MFCNTKKKCFCTLCFLVGVFGFGRVAKDSASIAKWLFFYFPVALRSVSVCQSTRLKK
jgi:uncharacterized membrane protein YtjA (UPF0391 family)